MSAEKLSRRLFIMGGLATTAGLIVGHEQPRTPISEPAYPRSTPASLIGPEAVVNSEQLRRVNMLDYILPAPRFRNESLTGTHLLSYHVDEEKKEFFIVKDKTGKRFEKYLYKDGVIRLILDTDPKRAYGLLPGLWMRVVEEEGDIIPSQERNIIIWYKNGKSCKINKIKPYRYLNTLIDVTNYDVGGDLGVGETAVVRYWPMGPAGPGYPEHFFFRRDRGLVEWQQRDLQDQYVIHRSQFNRIIDQVVLPDFDRVCR